LGPSFRSCTQPAPGQFVRPAPQAAAQALRLHT
jgi:hypothetical protein